MFYGCWYFVDHTGRLSLQRNGFSEYDMGLHTFDGCTFHRSFIGRFYGEFSLEWKEKVV